MNGESPAPVTLTEYPYVGKVDARVITHSRLCHRAYNNITSPRRWGPATQHGEKPLLPSFTASILTIAIVYVEICTTGRGIFPGVRVR